jgi:hypothetical protein
MSDQTWAAVEAYFESELIGADAVSTSIAPVPVVVILK